MKKLLLVSCFVFVLVGCGHKAEPTVEVKPAEEVKKEVPTETKKEEVLDQNSEIKDGLVAHREEGYEIKYPFRWAFYTGKVDFKDCGPEYYTNNTELGLPSSVIFLSKNKLADKCSLIDFQEGDIKIIPLVLGRDVNEKGGSSRVLSEKMNDKNFLKSNPGIEVVKIGGIDFIKHPKLKNSEGPRPNTTKFYGKSSMHEFYIEVRQLDDNGNIDPELMKVVNSMVIKR